LNLIALDFSNNRPDKGNLFRWKRRKLRPREKLMKLPAAAAGLFGILVASQLSAQEAYTRGFSCEGPDATMEIYVPYSALEDSTLKSGRTVLGFYALDLSKLNKGKALEVILVRFAEERRVLIVEQFTRGLPAIAVPIDGGVVGFDARFAHNAKCGPFEGGGYLSNP
jgi:hypothetical protein